MVRTLNVSLFGRFRVQYDAQTLHRLETAKARELFALLLVHRDRAHPREVLADMLWGGTAPMRSRKYLRQALWQLQAGLRFHLGEEGASIVMVDADWLRLRPDANLWLDVREFDTSCSLLQGLHGQELDEHQFRTLQQTVDLYQGDLLEGWYQDWCFLERTRLQAMYVTLLDKLMSSCEARGDHELALDYGERVIRVDPAYERAHRRLMRMYYLAGDRTAALRQYERCVAALSDELGVEPGQSTRDLYMQISTDEVDRRGGQIATPGFDGVPSSLPEILGHLRHMQALVSNVQRQLHDDITTVERFLAERQASNHDHGAHRSRRTA